MAQINHKAGNVRSLSKLMEAGFNSEKRTVLNMTMEMFVSAGDHSGRNGSG